MTEYEYPAEAKELMDAVTGLELRAKESERQVKDQLRHVRAIDRAKEKRLHERAEESDRREAELDERTAAFEALRERIGSASELIGEAWAQAEEGRAELESYQLRIKSHPAPTAAEAVKEKGHELAEAMRRVRAAEWIIQLYEWHFPWLTELREASETETYVAGEEEQERDREDPVSDWLTTQEWEALEPAQRNQLALDRYLKSRKTNWQLGRDYERYIGYLREQDGYAVTYQGIFKGLEDLGRDVLAEKDGAVEVIQCKRWAQHKTIHEKHIFQLYGTMVLAKLEQPDKEITGTFTTTTKLSEKAREVADYLDVKVEEGVPLDDYPRIKCNIARRGEERIYHLPFDQQYDTTLIEPGRGELYVATAAEAEKLGFRRAWRWKGSD